MKSAGSTPRAAGAAMAVFADSSIVGTIGGGSVENASIHAAVQVLKNGESEIREFDLTANDAASLGMVCGGEMTVLLDLMKPCAEHIALVKDILELYVDGNKSMFATAFDADMKILYRKLIPLNTSQLNGLKIDIPKDSRAPFIRSIDSGTLFIEPLATMETVHFIGAGHVAQATAHLAARTGFRVSVTDDREEFANATRYPAAHTINVVKKLGDSLPAQLGHEDYVVIMTRGHLHDRDVLAQALKTEAGSIGMIGSKKKRAATYESLLDNGFTQDDLKRVYCPIGLSIGADTPEEIAVSIMAELIQFRAQSTS